MMNDEPFAKFGKRLVYWPWFWKSSAFGDVAADSVRGLPPGRVVPPGSAGVPPASVRAQPGPRERGRPARIGPGAARPVRSAFDSRKGRRFSAFALGKSTPQRQVRRTVGGSGGGSHPVCRKKVRAGRPRSRVGFPPMPESHQGGKIAGVFRNRLSLKAVHLYSCLFVFIRGSSFSTATCPAHTCLLSPRRRRFKSRVPRPHGLPNVMPDSEFCKRLN